MIRVMIADDHAVMRDGVRHILERAGDFEVACEASDGTQVLQLVRDHQPQVIVLDLSMPGRSGLELLRQLHDDHPTVRVLVLTMHAEEQYVARAFRAGAAAYLTKESAATAARMSARPWPRNWHTAWARPTKRPRTHGCPTGRWRSIAGWYAGNR